MCAQFIIVLVFFPFVEVQSRALRFDSDSAEQINNDPPIEILPKFRRHLPQTHITL